MLHSAEYKSVSGAENHSIYINVASHEGSSPRQTLAWAPLPKIQALALGAEGEAFAFPLDERRGASYAAQGQKPDLASFAKRAMDIVGAAIALFLLAPLMILTAIAIRLETRGPVFFRQTRTGLNQQPFQIWKFRSMYSAEPAGSISAGWFLREFVEGFPWVHLDIAGTAYTDRDEPTRVKGPTGIGVRLFSELVLARSGDGRSPKGEKAAKGER